MLRGVWTEASSYENGQLPNEFSTTLFLTRPGAAFLSRTPSFAIIRLPPTIFGTSLAECRYIEETLFAKCNALLPDQVRLQTLRRWRDYVTVPKITLSHPGNGNTVSEAVYVIHLATKSLQVALGHVLAKLAAKKTLELLNIGQQC